MKPITVAIPLLAMPLLAMPLLAMPLLACSRSTPQATSSQASAGAADHEAAASSTPQHPSRAPAVDAIVQPLVERGYIPGLAIALADGGNMELLTYGRVRPDGPAVDTDTLFEIGSLTKVFTAALLQHMVEHGEANLDDRVASLLPEGTQLPAGGGDQIALIDLATHYSGLPRLPDDVSRTNDANPYADYDVQRMYDFLAGSTLPRPPGQMYEYSNLGFALLGNALANRAAGDYGRLVLDRIAGPLEMHDTWFALSDAQRDRLAQGQDPDGLLKTPWDLAAFMPAGGVRSSLHDMMRWLSAALAPQASALGGVLAETMRAHREIPGGKIGLAWHIMPDGLIWHNGETGGHHSFVGIDPSLGVGGVVLAASAGVVVDKLGMAVLDLIRGNTPQPIDLPADMGIDPSKLDEYAGTYRFSPEFAIKLWREGETLRAQATDQPAFRLWPSDTDLFYLRVIEAQIDFQRDPSGKIITLILHQPGESQQAFREPKAP